MESASSDNLFAKFEANPPADPVTIARCQSDFNFQLPPDYVRFLERMNGGRGFIGRHYLESWPVEELTQTNQVLMDGEPVPELFLFGCDGGGEGFAFDTRSVPPRIVVVPLIISLKDAIPVASSFDAFLQHLYHAEDLF